MRNAFTIFKKEMRRFFTDKRMLIALFFPGILIFVLYSAMGRLFSSILTSQGATDSSYSIAYTDNSGAEKPAVILNFEAYMANSEEEKTNKYETKSFPVSELSLYKEEVKNGTYDILVVFTDDFESKILVRGGSPLENRLDFYYNGATKKGTHVYQVIAGLVDVSYKNYVSNMTPDGKAIEPNLASSDYSGAMLLSILVPMLTMSMLFSSVLSITPDAIAGEKERGTLSSLLLTPVKRSEIALGKIAALSITAALSGLMSFLGLLGGLPNMISGVNFTIAPATIALLAVLIITTLILFVSIGTIVSALCKSTKECSSIMAPLMVLSMAAALLPLAIDPSFIAYAFVPFLNVASCMNVLLTTGSVGVPFMLVTIGMNALFTGVLIAITARLFRSERFMIK